MTRASTAPVREGDLLAGKYRVERVLGAGGMGVVVAARHEQLDQLVAIKFVRDEAIENEDAVQRFLREARAAVKLKSEHVARVLDVGKLESGAPYMVMEYLEGNDLGKVLEQEGPLTLEAAADWVLQACEAVAEAHAAGIVHRDLKPENLFLARTVGGVMKIKVLDFGVSKAMAGSSGDLLGLTRTRAMLGSPLYMAPEQMRSSRDVDPRCDVWALGVVLFQMLTRRWPFEADTMPALCLKVVSDPPMSLAVLRPDAPAALVAIVERCLIKDPAQRFSNAAELASALEPFAHPASQLVAARARLAIASSPSHSMSRQPVPSASTLKSESSGARLRIGATTPSAPGTQTPGTPAGWGAADQSSAGRRSRALWVLAGVSVAVIAAGLTIMAAIRVPASSNPPNPPPIPVGSSAAAGPTSSAVTGEANALPALEPAETLPSALLSVGASAGSAAAHPPSLPTALSPAPTPRIVSLPPPPHDPGAGVPGRPNPSDDDIPTMR
ncbi:MAG TPA: protein kinase [Polyangiaceae bacterium]|nr:protein kinase [Polyangiaceae bacterium]